MTLPWFIVESGDGLTRTIVPAVDAREARVKFLKAVPRGTVLTLPYEAVKVYPATPELLAELRKPASKVKFDAQLALDLEMPDAAGNARGPKSPRKPKTWRGYGS